MLDAAARAQKASELQKELNAIKRKNKKEYGKRLDQAQCTCGSMKQNINIPMDHGVYYQDTDHPLVNANDHVRDEHLLQFGRCTSDINPKNMAGEVAEKFATALGLGVMFKLAKWAKKKMGSEGCKCRPMTLNSWKDGDDANRLDGAPAILDYSQCVCKYGGVISVYRPSEDELKKQQGDSDAEPAEEDNIMDTLPPEIADKINSMNEAEGMQQDAADYAAANPDASAAAACSGAVSAQNALGNASQMPSYGSMNEGGYLTDTSDLGNFNIASSNMAALGGCAAGCFNTFKALGEPVSLTDTISLVETCQFPQGHVAIGSTYQNLGTMMMCMDRCGFESSLMSPDALLSGQDGLMEGDVAVLAVSNMRLADGQREFSTMVKGKDGFVCMEQPSLSSSEMIQRAKGKPAMVLGVSKRRAPAAKLTEMKIGTAAIDRKMEMRTSSFQTLHKQ